MPLSSDYVDDAVAGDDDLHVEEQGMFVTCGQEPAILVLLH
jgi:hypothetical protein